MAKNIQYITQLSADDISRMLDAGNLRAGKGIKVDRDDGGISLSVDINYIVSIIWNYINNGLCATVNNTDALSAVRDFNCSNL